MARLQSESLKADMPCLEMVDTSRPASLKIFHDVLWTIQAIGDHTNLLISEMMKVHYRILKPKMNERFGSV